jgi:NAD+ synthase
MRLTAKDLEDAMNLDYDREIERITSKIKELLRTRLHRRGLVVAMSGGIDSSVCAALSVKALGPKKVSGLLTPERDSSGESQTKGEILARHLGIDYTVKNITSTLENIGCYQWRDDAIRSVFPGYRDNWKNKIIIDGGLKGRINRFKLVVENPDGEQLSEVLPLTEYLTIVAATSFKQRVRKTVEYFHADRMNYAVVGTPNRLEYDQGFFVKGGDGLADVKPIAHLYKSQVYALARHMKLPDVICNAIPTTDTYSLEQGQDEFYFALPYQKMDIALWCVNNGAPSDLLAEYLGIETETAEYIYKDIKSKRKTTRYLHLAAQLIEPVSIDIE